MPNAKDRRSVETKISADRRIGRERRKHHRVSVDWAIDYGAKDTYLFSYISDISAMGIFVHTEQPQPIGTELTLRFTPPGRTKLQLEGVVTWINSVKEDNHPHRKPGMGIQFIKLQESQKQELHDLVQTMAILDHDLVTSS